MREYEYSKYRWDGVPEDMCTRCVHSSTNFTVEHEHEHYEAEEGVTEIKSSEY